MRKLHLFTAALLLLCIGCNKEENSTTSFVQNPNTQTITHNNQIREYISYIPNSYDGSTPVPVVFNFHGYSGSATNHMRSSDMRALADAKNFILVYPQGSFLNGTSHWNALPPGANNKSTADDFGFVEAMLQKITTEYAVDASRIYACGYSNGGMLAYGLANYKSELIAAVASVSGAQLNFNAPTHPMPVLHIHGTSDAVIPYNGNTFYNSTQAVLTYWIGFNNTVAEPIINSDSSGGLTIEHYAYNQGANGVSVEHYKYIEGNHTWFNQTYQGKNTGELIWNFMSKYDLNGLR